MTRKKTFFALAAAAFCSLSAGAQTVKLNGVYENNRYTDSNIEHSSYVGWNSALSKAIFIVDQGLYTMTWDGSALTKPEKEPAVNKEDFYVNGQYTDNEKAKWANDFNMMSGKSGAVYVNGTIVAIHSRDEQSTTDDELFRVTKWDAKTGNLLSNKLHPKSDCLESAGMAYNPVDGKVYGLFYLTGNQLPENITEDPDYFDDEDDDLTDGDAGYAICTIDLNTMKVTPITQGLYYQNFITFAINSEGRAFALTSGGSSGYIGEDGKLYNADNQLVGAQLYEFDLATGLMKTTDVQSVDPETGEIYTEKVSTYTHGTGYASQYRRQSACFSKSNPNIMYWNGYFNSGKGINDWGSWSSLSDKEWRTNGKYDTSLYAVDITTGDATRLSNIEERYSFSCLWVDGDDPSDGADIHPDVPEPDESAYIALSTADNGAIWQQVELGKQYTYYLEPAVGWKIHSVSFNNVEITDQLTENNMITTPVISFANNTLFVVFEEEEPQTDEIATAEKSASQVRILGTTGGVRIANANAGDVVQVYSVDGRLLQSQKLSAGRADISLGSKQLYIIKVAGKTVKVRL